MKNTQDISQAIQRLRAPATAKLDERIHREIDNAATPAPTAASAPEPTLGQIFAMFLKKQSTRYTLATTLGLALLAMLIFNHSTSSAWAMEDAIETLKKYKGLELSGNYSTDGKTRPIDLWLRADASGDFVEAVLAKVGDEATLWTRDKKTYTYVQNDKTVYVEPGITEALNPWPGPKLLALLPTETDYKAIEGDDPATGRKRAVVTCSSAGGDQSLLLEFDVRAKLLVSMKIWQNSRQEGTPNIDFEKILYFEDLPDSTFSFQPPSGTPYTNMPLVIPDSTLPAMSNMNYGISAEGMTREEACQKILEQYWAASIKYDFVRARQLMPSVAGSSDEFLRENWKLDGIVQVSRIGGIDRTGKSKLGPLALVPSWVRDQDGVVSEIWTIIQFRETDHGTSCVIYGPHGYAINVKE